MLNSANILKFYFICHLTQAEVGDNFGILAKVHDVLRSFNCPLKLTIATCLDPEGTFHLMRHITNGSADIQARVVRDTDDMTPHFLDKHHEAVIIDLNCNNTSKILGKISKIMFNLYKIIVYDSSCLDTNTKIKYLFEDIPILPMSQVFYISRESNQRKFSVKQVYRMGTNEPLVVEENVIEDSATALTPTLRRRNLQGFRLKASLVVTNNDSLNHLNDYRDVHIDALSKVTYILTKELMRFVNATVKYNILSTWGYKDKTTGKWNGVVGQLISNEADVGASPLFFIAERVSLVEYISRPTSADGGFIFRAPKLSYTNNIFLLPFDRFLWMCLCGLVLLIAMFLGGTVFIESKIVKSEIECRTNDVYMIVWGAMCQQGSSVTPTGSTGRIVMAITFIILMFLFVSYSANIVALLQSSSNKIRTLQDLYESKIDASVEDAIYTRHYFPLATGTLRRKFYEEKLLNKDGMLKVHTVEDGMKRIREGQNAFFTEFASAYKVISETFMDIEKCGLQEMRFFEMKTSPWYVIQKNSSYNEIFKIGMKRIYEHGVQQRENLRYYLRKPECSGSGANFASATLSDTGPAMLLLVWGMAIAVVVFICEIISSRFNRFQFKFTHNSIDIQN